jgi:Ca2+-binding EF-hand superfamily protein
MKKLILMLALACATSFTVKAADTNAAPHHPEATAEQKAVREEMLKKYDANKDGKLDKEERTKMSAEDIAKWKAAFPSHKKAAN